MYALLVQNDTVSATISRNSNFKINPTDPNIAVNKACHEAYASRRQERLSRGCRRQSLATKRPVFSAMSADRSPFREPGARSRIGLRLPVRELCRPQPSHSSSTGFSPPSPVTPSNLKTPPYRRDDDIGSADALPQGPRIRRLTENSSDACIEALKERPVSHLMPCSGSEPDTPMHDFVLATPEEVGMNSQDSSFSIDTEEDVGLPVTRGYLRDWESAFDAASFRPLQLDPTLSPEDNRFFDPLSPVPIPSTAVEDPALQGPLGFRLQPRFDAGRVKPFRMGPQR